MKLSESPCVVCGQCSSHCPSGAIFEKDDTLNVWQELQDPDNHCVVQMAPVVRVAVAHGLGHVMSVLNRVREARATGEPAPYDFIEVMACPGGQPYGVTNEIRTRRAQGLYQDDRDKELRLSHENPQVQKLYDEYLQEPLSPIAHELLHTHYVKRGEQ